MESINHPPLVTRVLLALVQHIAMNEHQRARLDLRQLVDFLLDLAVFDQIPGPLRTFVVDEARSRRRRRRRRGVEAHEAVPDRCPFVRPCGEGQAAVFDGAVFECVPESYGAGRVRVQECAVLMRGDAAADLGLFADYHGLEDAGVVEAERLGDS